MESTIRAEVGAIFVPVSDIDRAMRFYSALFGVEFKGLTHEGRIADLPLSNGQTLILDGHKPVANSSQPLCFLWCDDIQAAYAWLTAESVTIARAVEDIGSLYTLTFADPDGNLLMVCQRK